MRLPWPRLLTDERGLTLAEILVALLVIGVGLVGIAVVVPVSSYGVQEGNQLSTATFLAEQMIERTRSVAWTAVPAIDCLGLSAGDTAPTATCGGPTAFPTFTVTYRGLSAAGQAASDKTVRLQWLVAQK